jgi:cellulose synthase/poly-beta-1,6-N-acetylglucosamine synthase-like glycosyltransferase
MTSAEYIFWICLILVAYTYVLYPILLFLAYSLEQVRRDWHYLTGRRNRRCTAPAAEDLPPVSLIVPAYNEEARLCDKIANVRQLDYPRDKLEVIFVSDGSTDRTNEMLQAIQDPNIRTVILPARRGKPTALNHAVSRAKHDILIFSDAATLFASDAVKKLVRHFFDPRVGVVCGALQFQGISEFHQTEGVYWKYESMLRLMESRLGATLTASGAIYALRHECYRPLAANVLIDDFVIPINARRLGYRVNYDPEAAATDFASPSVAGEFNRRVRLAVGSFRALGELVRVPFDPITFLAFFSHKFLRWVLPFLMIGLLVSSGLLWDTPLYRVAFTGQLLFYLWAELGYVFRERMVRFRYGLMGYYVVAIHLAFLVGFIRFLLGQGEATWRREEAAAADRTAAPTPMYEQWHFEGKSSTRKARPPRVIGLGDEKQLSDTVSRAHARAEKHHLSGSA